MCVCVYVSVYVGVCVGEGVIVLMGVFVFINMFTWIMYKRDGRPDIINKRYLQSATCTRSYNSYGQLSVL